MTRTQKWSAGTTVLVLLVLVTGWLVLLAPQRTEAADLRTQAADAGATNSTLQREIAQLEAQSLELPAKQAELAEFAERVPPTVDLPALVRDLTAAATRAGAELQGLTPQPAQALTASTTTTDAAASTGSGLSAVPVALTVGGTFPDVQRFLFELETSQRAFLVTGFTVQEEQATGATAPGTDPVALEGPLTVEVQGRAFVDPTATGAPPATGGTSGTVPAPPTTTSGSTSPSTTPAAPAAAAVN
jgi:type IV pilus assembly protein PilO